jgi:hypothetical protein
MARLMLPISSRLPVATLDRERLLHSGQTLPADPCWTRSGVKVEIITPV